MLFFAFVDPLILVDALNIAAIESRNAGYAIGFALFFANTWIAGWFTNDDQEKIRRQLRIRQSVS